MRWVRWLVRTVVWGATGVLVLAFAAAFVLTRTEPGVDFVVRQGLERLEASIEGTIAVEAVESPDLLDGARLRGVELRDVEGRLLARFDTLGFTYSVPALLRGNVVLYDVEARGFLVRIERLHGQDAVNATRIFGGGGDEEPSDGAPGDGEAPGPRVVLRDVLLSRGEVEVLLPVEDGEKPSEGAFTVADPTGTGALRQYAVREIEAELPRIDALIPGDPARTFRVSRLAAVAEIQREPVRIAGFRGNARLLGSVLAVEGMRVDLGRSRARGSVQVDWGGSGVETEGSLVLEPLDLGDLGWLVADLPKGRVDGEVDAHVGPDSTVWSLGGARLTTPSSSVVADGRVRTAPELRFDDLVVDLEPLTLAELRPWLDRELPPEGAVEGTVQMDGTARGLAVGGLLTLHGAGTAPSGARLSGLVSLDGEAPSVEGFQLDLRPFDFGLLSSIWPDVEVPGSGSVLLEAEGSLAEGLRLIADVEHGGSGFARSRIDAAGTVRVDSTDVHLEIDGEVDPLDLRLVRVVSPNSEVEGRVEGPVRIAGRLGDLRVTTDLVVPAGRIAADVRFDARDPAAGYRIEAEATDVRLSELLPELPAPTTVSGTVSATGSGLDRESVRGRARVTLGSSRAGRFTADTAAVELAVEGGRVRVDTLLARTNVAEFTGSGELGLGNGSPGGRVRVSFRNDSLVSVRSLLLGDSLIVADTLSTLEREVLQVDGIDPDTLPTEAAVRMEGRLAGDVTLEGTVDAFTVDGDATVDDFAYGPNTVRSARITFSGADLPSLDGALSAVVAVDSVHWSGRSFDAGTIDVEYTRPSGRAVVEVVRSDREDYRARGRFDLAEGATVVEVDELALRFEPVRWVLEEPARVEWGDGGLRVTDFRLVRPGADPMRVVADGVLPFQGDADFDLEVVGLSLERLADLTQSEERVGGSLALQVRVRGTAERPLAAASLQVDSLRFRNVVLSRVEGTVDYENRRVQGDLQAFREGRLSGRMVGTVPVDLSLREVEDRIPRESMDLRVVVDDFPAVLLATVTDALEDVQGSVSGDVLLQGTIDEPETSGRFRVQDLAFRLPALGIRPSNIVGTLDLLDAERVRVDLEGRSAGPLHIQGTVGLSPLTDPSFDLTIEADGFQAVNRRDLQGRLGARVTLEGSYRRPVVSGSARMQESVLRVEELERSAEVVDLTDPRFFDVVDTTSVTGASELQESENPFLRNLQLDVDLRVERDTWLRGRDMNVEMRGDLVINWNRTSGELVLTGQLTAVRGTYSVFQRQFQVTEGTIEFVGTPGLNPNLSIGAVSRLRTREGDALTVTAGVSGTLLEPRVRLTSDAQPPIAESDLVSYLLFGRPSYALASGESRALQGRLEDIAGSVGLGVFAQQLGSAAQQVGVDYFAVSQTPSIAGEETGSLGGAAAATQVEAGWYLRQNVFVSLLVRPLAPLGSTSPSPFSGVRAEWQLGDVWTVEGFVEDRFSRQRVVGFGDDLGFDAEKILGFFLYRDWGY